MPPWPGRLTALLVFSCAMSYASTGQNAIAYMTFKDWLGLSDDDSTMAFSVFRAVLNVAGVVGALAADWRYGSGALQWWTSVIWIVGSVCLVAGASSSSLPKAIQFTLGGIGMTLSAIGTGAQGPTQAAFLGDQTVGDAKQYATFFAIYYVALNIGALGGETVCPILRVHTGIFVAFLSVAVLQLGGVAAWIVGRKDFVYVQPKPVPSHAAHRNCLKFHLTNYTARDVAEIKRILWIFLPTVFYWALFTQQNSTWVDQADQMDLKMVWGTPDAMPGVEDFFVIILVPLMNRVACCGVRCRPLRRLSLGIFVTGAAFLCSGFLQIAINNAKPHKLSVAWQLPQWFLIAVAEVLVAVTGLEFAYSECGPDLKSSIQALWQIMQLGQLMSGFLAIGGVSQSANYFIGAACMGLMTVVFVLIASRYKYRKPLPTPGKAPQHASLLPHEESPLMMGEDGTDDGDKYRETLLDRGEEQGHGESDDERRRPGSKHVAV